MRDATPADDENNVTIGPRSKIRVELVIALVAGIGWVGWVTSELNTVKSMVASKNDSVAVVQGEVRSVQADLKILGAKMDQFERNGSVPLQNLQKCIDEMRFKLDAQGAKLDMHMGIEPKKGTP